MRGRFYNRTESVQNHRQKDYEKVKKLFNPTLISYSDNIVLRNNELKVFY